MFSKKIVYQVILFNPLKIDNILKINLLASYYGILVICRCTAGDINLAGSKTKACKRNFKSNLCFFNIRYCLIVGGKKIFYALI